MSFLILILKNAFRNRLRTVLTVFGVALTIIAFLFLHSFVSAWSTGADAAASDRLLVRNKISLAFPLPLAYVEKARKIPGIAALTFNSWFGAVYINERNSFAQFAVDDSFFAVVAEVELPAAQLQAYLHDRTGAVVGSRLAEKYHWKIGDRITLTGTVYPGYWDFTIRGIYESTAKSFNSQTMFFHWRYLNERLPERYRDQIGVMLVKVTEHTQSNAIAAAIDKLFENSAAETRTESEKVFVLQFVSMASAVINAIKILSGVVLLILLLVIGNTMAMATHERTAEYAVMRIIGFRTMHIVALVVVEGFVIAALGAAVGLALAVPIHEFVLTIFEGDLGTLGDFTLEPFTVVMAVVVTLISAMLASAIPAWRAGRLRLADALRRVD